MQTPPEKLSDLIDLALNDLRKVQADPRYVVDMTLWHEPNTDDGENYVCHVCFAGAVMAKTLAVDVLADSPVSDFGHEWRRAFYALDDVRTGNLTSTSVQRFIPRPLRGLVGNRYVPHYDPDNPEHFTQAMTQLRNDLRMIGA